LKQIQLNSVDSRDNAQTSLGVISSCSSLPKRSAIFESLLIYENYPTPSDAAHPTEDKRALMSTLEKETVYEKTSVPLTIIAEMEHKKLEIQNADDDDGKLHEEAALKVMMLSMDAHTEADLEQLQLEIRTVLEQLVVSDHTTSVGELVMITDVSFCFGLHSEIILFTPISTKIDYRLPHLDPRFNLLGFY
jgi:hypothetical protein